MRLLATLLLAAVVAGAQEPALIESVYSAKEENTLAANPSSGFWRKIPAITAENDPMGRAVPGHRTAIRSRWTTHHLYLLYVCPYDELYLKPNPVTNAETNQLWNWDVAEVFIGSDFQNIKRYKEFEVSPQGEWVDLDIDLGNPHKEDGWTWNSGFEVKTRVDRKNKIWYAEMKIPFHAIDSRAIEVGVRYRVNFYRIEGPPPDRKFIAWQPTHSDSYHVPEAFGQMLLVRP